MGNKLTKDDNQVLTTHGSNAKYHRLGSAANAKQQTFHTPTPFSNTEINEMYCKIIEEDNLLN